MRILNLGAGVQSTTLFLMGRDGTIPPFDHAIFADTQEEPEAVYAHLLWLQSLDNSPPIHVASRGKLGDDLIRETAPSIPHADGFPYKEHHKHRFASIPCFTAKLHTERQMRESCNEGMVQRQCTKEYKIEVIERVIRRIILGLKPRQRMPATLIAEPLSQAFGMSADERGRAKRVAANYESKPWVTPIFPLLDLGMTRDDCKRWLADRVPHEVPRSACVFCPYKTSEEWLRTKADTPSWERAVEVDRALREPGRIVNRRMELALYLHRECIPLEDVDLEAAAAKERTRKARPLFDLMDCGEGMCGV